MNSGLQKKIIILVVVSIYIVIGFFREFIFLNINEQIRVVYYHETDSHVSNAMQWISQFSYSTLYYSKWLLTLTFTTIFALIAGLAIKIAFAEKTLVRITWLVYAAVFVLGLLFFIAGSVSGNIDNTYNISRFIAGLTETPALLAILFATFLALRRN